MPSPEISPPPLKRRRISASPPHEPHHPSPPLPTHDPLSTPIPNSLHIYSWNINGITPFLPPSTPPITTFLKPTSHSSKPPPPPPPPSSLRANLKRWNWPHILCLQEVKIAPTDSKSQLLLRRIINTPLPSEDDENPTPHHLYDAHFSLPRDPHNATGFSGKIYGVCTLLRRDIHTPTPATTTTVDWDLEGRVLITVLPSFQICVINIYAVNGTSNPYRDPATGKVIGTRHDRKRVFHSLLCDEVRRYEERGWHVVVAGDMNVSKEEVDSFPALRMGEEHVRSRRDFEKLFIEGAGMVDTFRKMWGGRRKFSYRPRNKPWGEGGDRVDLILVSKGLEGRVKGADVLDCEEERGVSDHVPLWVEVGGGGVGGGEVENDEAGG